MVSSCWNAPLSQCVQCMLRQRADAEPCVMPLLLQGILRGYDQATNLILDDCHERVYSTKVVHRSDSCLSGMATAAKIAFN